MTDANEIHLNEIKVTPRDQQVLNLLVQGCSNKEIAGQLQISPRTVKQHLRTLFLRAGIRDGRKRVKLAIAVYDAPQRDAQRSRNGTAVSISNDSRAASRNFEAQGARS
jgi:DNA-binding CsgD family transcriptional regulator